MAAISWKTEFKRITPNVCAYIQGGGPGIENTGYSNAGVIFGEDAAMVVDTLQAPIPSNAFLAEITKVSTKPVRHVVNTHGHSDHTSGNQFFMQAYKPEIIAHERARELTITMGAGRNRTGGGPNWLAAPGLAVGSERYINTPATTTIPTSVMNVYYGSMKIELHAVDPAHTTGDVMVYVRQQKIVFGGDICIFDVGPLGGGSCLGTMRALEWILSVDPEWVVPGHGPVGTKQDVQKELEYFATIRDGMAVRIASGLSPGAAAATIDMDDFMAWPDSNRYFGNAMRMYQDLTGKILDQAATATALDEYQKITKK